MKTVAPTLVLIAAVIGPCWAQTGEPRPYELSLEEALQRAVQVNERLRAGAAEVTAGEAARGEASAGRYPSVDLEAGYARLQKQDPATLDLPDPPAGPGPVELGDAVSNSYSATVRLRQPLFTGGTLNSGVEAADHELAARQAELGWVRSGVLLETRAAYWELLEAEQRVAATHERERQVEANLRSMRERRENGMVTRSEVLTVEMRLAEAQLQSLRARNASELALTRLALLVGLPPEEGITPVTELHDPGAASGLELSEVMIERALTARGDLRALRLRVASAQAAVEAARGALYPQLSLTGEYTYARPNLTFFPPQNEFKDSWRLGVAGRLELGSMPRVVHRTRRLQAQQHALEARVREAEQAVRLSVRRSYLGWRSAAEEVALARIMVRQAEENLADTQARVENGVALNEDLLEAQATLMHARLALTSARTRRQTARETLARVSGEEP